ncbi:MAG: hypothetical protein ACREVR_18350 [Burkholderiales bacterium]
MESVRNVRTAHAARFGYDLAAICRDFREREKASGHPLARRAPKLRLKKTGS